MDDGTARSSARTTRDEESTVPGGPLADHVHRVTAAVARDAQPVAFLHDILAQTPTTVDALQRDGLTELELATLELLTQGPDESYELYVLRIAHAPGAAGRLARTVKLADLEDQIARPWTPHDPPYAWARRHIVNARRRRDGQPQPPVAAPAVAAAAHA